MRKALSLYHFLIIAASMLSAQNAERPWLFGVSANYADFNVVEFTFTDQLTDANWMGRHQPSQLKVSRFLSKSFNFSFKFSYISLEVDKLNKIPLKTFMTTDKFSRFGGQFEYKLSNGNILKENAKFSPYAFLGFSGTNINEQTYLTQSTGVGLNLWLNNWLGLNFEGSHEYNLVFNNYLHYSFGLVFTLKSDREPVIEEKTDTFDLCPIINRLKNLYDCPKPENDTIDRRNQPVEKVSEINNGSISPESIVSDSEFSDQALHPENESIPIKLTELTPQVVYFEVSSARLPESSFYALDEVVRFLKMNPRSRIAIYGHTDNSGDIGFNKILSEERANSVANYLFFNDIIEEQLITRGFGGKLPAATNKTPEGRALNRRAEIKLISKYHLVIGSFQKEKNAKKTTESFAKKGYSPTIIGQDVNGRFRVAIASFEDRDEAEKEMAKVKALFVPDAWLLEE
jgi:outer membrane protein OmpA-like peptidoglycan-associated protein